MNIVKKIKKRLDESDINLFQLCWSHYIAKKRIRRSERYNFIKSLYVNLCLMPLRDALKLPILIYGKCTLYELGGRVRFNVPVKKGLLKIGQMDPVRSYYSKSFLSIRGELVVGANVTLRRGINIQILKDACVQLDDYVYIGDNCTIISRNKIHLGIGTRVGNNTTFMDTDFHFIINTETKQVKNNVKPIYIGDYNWIGGNCIIKKGTKTPKGTILAGPYSMISKDYSNRIPEYSIIAGSPAKLLCENYRRINNNPIESKLWEVFKTGKDVYTFDENLSIDSICLPQANM